MRYLISYIFTLLLFVYVTKNGAVAQNLLHTFQHYNNENGLSNNAVSGIVQDNKGFIWIGTDDGLNRFDGYSCKVFHHSSDSNSISADEITCLFKDKSGRIIIGTPIGINIYNSSTGVFTKYAHEKGNPSSLINNDVTAITQDENGRLWIGTRSGIEMFEEDKKKFTHYQFKPPAQLDYRYDVNRVTCLAPDMHGTIWIGTLNGILKLNIKNKDVIQVYTNGDTLHTQRCRTTGLTFDKTGNLWIAFFQKGVGVLSTTNDSIKFITVENSNGQLNSNDIANILCDANNNVWIAHRFKGINTIDAVSLKYENYVHDIFDANSLADDKTNIFFIDKSKMLWIGLSADGFDRLSPLPDKFNSMVLQPGKPGSLCDKNIQAADEDKNGNLWIGSTNGLMFYNRQTNYFTCFRHEENNANSLSQNLVHDVKVDHSGNIWVATENGLNLYNPASGKWKHYLHDKRNPRSLPADIIFSLCVLKNGNVLGGTTHGPLQYHPDGDWFDNRDTSREMKKLVHEFYFKIFENSKNQIFLTTSRSGVYLVDSNFNIIKYFSGGDKPDNLPSSAIADYAEDDKGNVWIATFNGLCKLNPSTHQFTIYNHEQGLASDKILSVKIAGDNSLWVTTVAGLSKINFDERGIPQIKNFTKSDGLQGSSFNFGSSLKLKTGELFFGGSNGCNLFNPENISFNKTVPDVEMTSFKVFNKELNENQNYESLKEINLAYDENFFTVEMAAMNFNHPEKNQFAYQLIGFDRQKINSGMNHSASYTGVPPGSYTLHIEATNNDGVWNYKGFDIRLNIAPPFWKTSWFRFLLLLFSSGIVYAIFYLRIRSIKKREQLKIETNKRIAEVEMRALRAQMNPHFIFNCLNSINRYILKNDQQGASLYLTKFSKLIRLILDNSQNKNVLLSDELEALKLYIEMEALRFDKKFSYNIAIDKNVRTDSIEVPPLIIQPYVENAIWHGLLHKSVPGNLSVSVIQKNGVLECLIEDNGVGREKATQLKSKSATTRKSLGMQLTEERISILNNYALEKASVEITDLKNESGDSNGTRVKILMPYTELKLN